MGADEVINSRQVDCAAEARHMTRGRGVDVVVEMIGLSETLEASLGSVGKGGRIVFVGFYDQGRIHPVITRVCKLQEADEVLRSMARMALAGRACAMLFSCRTSGCRCRKHNRRHLRHGIGHGRRRWALLRTPGHSMHHCEHRMQGAWRPFPVGDGAVEPSPPGSLEPALGTGGLPDAGLLLPICELLDGLI